MDSRRRPATDYLRIIRNGSGFWILNHVGSYALDYWVVKGITSAGFGLGAFFHYGTISFLVTIESELGTIGLPIIELPTIGFPTEPLRTTVAYEDSRFAYQIMAGLSTRVSPRVEFHFGYRFRSSRGALIDADQIEAGIRFRF